MGNVSLSESSELEGGDGGIGSDAGTAFIGKGNERRESIGAPGGDNLHRDTVLAAGALELGSTEGDIAPRMMSPPSSAAAVDDEPSISVMLSASAGVEVSIGSFGGLSICDRMPACRSLLALRSARVLDVRLRLFPTLSPAVSDSRFRFRVSSIEESPSASASLASLEACLNNLA